MIHSKSFIKKYAAGFDIGDRAGAENGGITMSLEKLREYFKVDQVKAVERDKGDSNIKKKCRDGSDNKTGDNSGDKEEGENKDDNDERIYEIVKTMGEVNLLVENLQKKPEWSFDIETSSLDFLNGKVLGISFSWEEGQGVYLPLLGQDCIEIWSKDDKERVIPLLKQVLENGSVKIAHNAKFDVKFLRGMGFHVKVDFDTMLAHHLLQDRPHGLKELVKRYFQSESNYEGSLKDHFKTKDKNFADVPLDVLAKYAAMDTDFTFRLYELFKAELKKDERLNNLFETLVMPLSELLTKVETEGVKVDIEYCKKLEAEYKQKAVVLSQEIEKAVGEKFNINSSKDLNRILFEKLGIKPCKKTPKGNWSTDKESMEELAEQHHVPKLILEYRKLEKVVSTFLSDVDKKLDSKGRIHTDYRIHGTETGRLSSSNPNLQNIPRDKNIRRMFVAETGNKFLVFDYEQIEVRMAAVISKDSKLIECVKSKDVHCLIAAEIFKKKPEEVTKDERSKAKTVVFGVMYGMGKESLAKRLKITTEEASLIINSFFDRFQRLKRWINETKERTKITGLVKNYFGRKRNLPDATLLGSHNSRKMGGALIQSVNTPIQSSSSDFVNMAALRADKKLRELGLSAKLILLVHDELVFEVLDSEVDKTREIIKNELEMELESVPFKVKDVVSDHWCK